MKALRHLFRTLAALALCLTIPACGGGGGGGGGDNGGGGDGSSDSTATETVVRTVPDSLVGYKLTILADGASAPTTIVFTDEDHTDITLPDGTFLSMSDRDQLANSIASWSALQESWDEEKQGCRKGELTLVYMTYGDTGIFISKRVQCVLEIDPNSGSRIAFDPDGSTTYVKDNGKPIQATEWFTKYFVTSTPRNIIFEKL